MKASTMTQFDTTQTGFGSLFKTAIVAPEKHVIRLNSVKIITDLTKLTGTAGKNFDDNPLNLFAIVRDEKLSMASTIATPVSLLNEQSAPSAVFEPIVKYHTDSEAHIVTSITALVDSDRYMCEVSVGLGRSSNTAQAKGIAIESLFIIDYDFVKLTSTIMASMMCGRV